MSGKAIPRHGSSPECEECASKDRQLAILRTRVDDLNRRVRSALGFMAAASLCDGCEAVRNARLFGMKLSPEQREAALEKLRQEGAEADESEWLDLEEARRKVRELTAANDAFRLNQTLLDFIERCAASGFALREIACDHTPDGMTRAGDCPLCLVLVVGYQEAELANQRRKLAELERRAAATCSEGG